MPSSRYLSCHQHPDLTVSSGVELGLLPGSGFSHFLFISLVESYSVTATGKGSQPGTSQSPSSAMSTPVKHPQTFQCPQHPQPPRSATNHNSERPNLLDQAVPLSAQLLLLSLAQTLGLLVGLSVSLLIVGVRV